MKNLDFKGSKWKGRAMAVGVLLLGLLAAGCGKTQGATTAQKEFVYVPEYQTMSLEQSADQINVMGDTIYFITGYFDEAASVYRQSLGILKADETTPELRPLDFGSDFSISGLNFNMEGSLQAVVTTNILKEGADTAEGELPGEESEPVSSEAEEEAVAEGETEEAPAAAEGAEAALSGTFSDEYVPDGDAEGEYEMKTEVCSFRADGTVLSRVDVTHALDEPQYTYIQNMASDKEGNLYLACDDKIYILDPSGSSLGKIEMEGWINDLFALRDGTVMAVYYGEKGVEIHPIDGPAKKVGENIKEMMLSDYGSYTFMQGTDTDFLFTVDNGLYTYNMGDNAPVEVLKWTDCDVDSDRLSSFSILEDGRILAVTSFWNEDGENTTDMVYLTKTKGSEVKEKKILTFGTLSLGYDMKSQIIDFNKTNQEYRIEIKEYLEGADTSIEGYQAAREQMNADIISGRCPDIIDLSDGNLRMYAAKGVLEDLYPYMEADPEIHKEDYVENILQAFETDGRLYALPPRFYINTTMARVSDVGEKTSITVEELTQLMDGLPEGTELYQYATKETILLFNLMMNLDEYVDWSTGKCRFDSQEFIQSLEFANRFEKEASFGDDEPSMPTKIRERKLMMVNTSIGSVQEYQMYQGMFGEPVTFVGYPTSKASGSMISGTGSMAGISAKSAYKDGAWAFIREELTKEKQEKGTEEENHGFPVMKSALEVRFAKDMEDSYYEDEDGNKKKEPKTTWGYDDFEIEIYAATEEDIAAVKKLIESADTMYQYDEQIMNIISEETGAFFEGQKGAKDAADIIQNRVQIYVNENR